MLLAAALLTGGCSETREGAAPPEPKASPETLTLTSAAQVQDALGDVVGGCRQPVVEPVLYCSSVRLDDSTALAYVSAVAVAFQTSEELRVHLLDQRERFQPSTVARPAGFVLGETWLVGIGAERPVTAPLAAVNERLGGTVAETSSEDELVTEALRLIDASD